MPFRADGAQCFFYIHYITIHLATRRSLQALQRHTPVVPRHYRAVIAHLSHLATAAVHLHRVAHAHTGIRPRRRIATASIRRPVHPVSPARGATLVATLGETVITRQHLQHLLRHPLDLAAVRHLHINSPVTTISRHRHTAIRAIVKRHVKRCADTHIHITAQQATALGDCPVIRHLAGFRNGRLQCLLRVHPHDVPVRHHPRLAGRGIAHHQRVAGQLRPAHAATVIFAPAAAHRLARLHESLAPVTQRHGHDRPRAEVGVLPHQTLSLLSLGTRPVLDARTDARHCGGGFHVIHRRRYLLPTATLRQPAGHARRGHRLHLVQLLGAERACQLIPEHRHLRQRGIHLTAIGHPVTALVGGIAHRVLGTRPATAARQLVAAQRVVGIPQDGRLVLHAHTTRTRHVLDDALDMLVVRQVDAVHDGQQRIVGIIAHLAPSLVAAAQTGRHAAKTQHPECHLGRHQRHECLNVLVKARHVRPIHVAAQTRQHVVVDLLQVLLGQPADVRRTAQRTGNGGIDHRVVQLPSSRVPQLVRQLSTQTQDVPSTRHGAGDVSHPAYDLAQRSARKLAAKLGGVGVKGTPGVLARACTGTLDIIPAVIAATELVTVSLTPVVVGNRAGQTRRACHHRTLGHRTGQSLQTAAQRLRALGKPLPVAVRPQTLAETGHRAIGTQPAVYSRTTGSRLSHLAQTVLYQPTRRG